MSWKNKVIARCMGLAIASAGVTLGIAQRVQAAEPIKMLAIDVMSGPFKEEGEQYLAGVRFAVDQINRSGGINGRPIQLFVDDSELKPDVAQRKALHYVLDEHVKIIVGAVGTAITKSLAQVAHKNHVILAAYSGEADEITGKEFQPEVFRLVLSTTMHAKGTVAAFPKPYKNVYLLNQDNAFGHSAAESYKKVLNQLDPGWKLVGDDYHPIATKDFAPYLQKVMSSGADVVLTGDYSADMTLLLKQAASFGVKQPFGNMFLSNPIAMREIGDAAIGDFTSDIYMVGVDTPANKAFLQQWKAYNKDPKYTWPDFGIGKAYDAVMFVAAALKKAGSDDPDKVIHAFEGLTFDGPMGHQVMRACDHQIQSPVASATIVKGPTPFYPFASTGPVTLQPLEKVAVAPADTGNSRCMKP